MITKFFYIFILFLFFLETSMSQEKMDSDTLRDVNRMPWGIFANNSVQSWEYLTLEGEKIAMNNKSKQIVFRNGKDSLDRYVKRYFYAQKGENYAELNQRIVFTILFDDDLNIIEVRQLFPPFIHGEKEYATIFSEILKETIGMWGKKNENDYYLYVYLTHLF